MGNQKHEEQHADALRSEPDEPEVATEGTPAGAAVPEDEEPLARAERERDEYLASWQRAQADYQNLKRRTFQDIQAAVRREQTLLLGDFLQVLDYLDMALASPCEHQDARNLLVGVQMTRDQLWGVLERLGVAPIATDGAFEPERHPALATVATDDVPPGEIVAVVRTGFMLGDAVLRHAHVKVAATDNGDEPSPSTDGA
jgi:molecular chaperone GrpE